MKFSPTPLVVCAIAALLAPSAASGQTTAGQTPAPAAPPPQSSEPAPESVRRPFRGLFGAPADPRTSKQSLDLRLSAFGAYDDDLIAADSGGTVTTGYQQPGWYSGATAGVSYDRPGDRFNASLDGDAAVNRYPKETTTMYRAGGSASARLARYTRLTFGGDFVSAPQYRLGLFASPGSLTGLADPFGTVATDLDLFSLHAYRSSAQAALSQGLGRHASLQAFYSMYDVNYTDSDFDYRSNSAGILFSDHLTQHLGFHLGYRYESADYAQIVTSRPRRIHNIDAGVDYGRALSVSRRTTLSFSTGSAIVRASDQFAVADNANFQFRLTGDATLRHEIGRTWTAALGYQRSVDWHEGFVDPFLSDSVNAQFGGFMSRRVRFDSSADYTFGHVGFGSANNAYDSGYATAGLEYALSRTLALFGRYVYYRYHFDSGVTLDPRFVPALDRQGVRFGINASFPIVR